MSHERADSAGSNCDDYHKALCRLQCPHEPTVSLPLERAVLMANGKLGDDPLTDMLVYGRHPFPEDMELTLRKILALEPWFPDGQRPYVDQVAWVTRFWDWAAGKNLDEGRQALQAVWRDLTRKPDR